MRQLRSLVLLLAVAALAALLSPPVSRLAAQSAGQARVARDAEVRATPNGSVIATVQVGTEWKTGAVRSGSTMLTIEGWVDASRLGGRRDSFPESIGGAGTLRIRAEGSRNGRILGVFSAGAGVRLVERSGAWVRVRRGGWILNSALGATSATPAASGANPAATVTPAIAREPTRAPARDGALRATAALTLRNAPGADSMGTLGSGAVVDPIARDRGWVRIRVEAWVPESLLAPADSAYEATLTAADLRLAPVGLRGRIVRWTVQVVGLQTADPLRRALAPDEPYLLAMGPGSENAILYLAVPPSLLAQAKALAPLANVVITARVRTGRSEPTGAPVLDLLSITRR